MLCPSTSVLIHGYIRINQLCEKTIFPLEIIQTCTNYFGRNIQYLLLWTGSYKCYNKKYNAIYIKQWNNIKSKRIKLSIKSLTEQNVTNNNEWDKNQFGKYVIRNSTLPKALFTQFPNHTQSFNKNTLYDIIFTLGGMYENTMKPCASIYMLFYKTTSLMQIKNSYIQAYYVNLSTFPQSQKCSNPLYNSMDRNLIHYSGSKLYHFNLDTFKTVEKQIMIPTSDFTFRHGNLCWLNGMNEDIMLINQFCHCYMLSYKDEHVEAVTCAKMNLSRYNPGICNIINDRIVVAGGRYRDSRNFRGRRSIEIYDAYKNKFELHGVKFKYSYEHPIVWTDCLNKNMIFIAGDKYDSVGAGQNGLGFIEWCDLRELGKTKKWNILYLNDDNTPMNISTMYGFDETVKIQLYRGLICL
eukprot:239408_1